MKSLSLYLLAFFCFFNTLFAQQKASEDLYISRLASLKMQVEIVYHPAAKKYIDEYIDNPEKTRELIGLSKFYFPMIERALKSKNLPVELKYLPLAVSELNPSAQNVSGACGIWMMGYNVSKMYKVKVNSFVDERRDPLKSSTAAAAHFKDLYSIYKQWPLVIAAYGCSPVMLNKCIRSANNSVYFGDVYPYIPDATRDIYPKFIAAVYIMNFYKEHGIKPVYSDLYLETDSVLVNKWLSLQQISSTIDVSLDHLRKLNPSFKKDVIPYNLDGYWIKLPKNKGKQYILLKDSVYNPLPRSTEFSPVAIQKDITDSVVVPAETKKTKNSSSGDSGFNKKKISYTVKRGEKLADIADIFDVSVSEIKSWNKMKSLSVTSGKRVTIWVNASKTGYYKRINSMSAKQKKALRKKD